MPKLDHLPSTVANKVQYRLMLSEDTEAIEKMDVVNSVVTYIL